MSLINTFFTFYLAVSICFYFLIFYLENFPFFPFPQNWDSAWESDLKMKSKLDCGESQ